MLANGLNLVKVVHYFSLGHPANKQIHPRKPKERKENRKIEVARAPESHTRKNQRKADYQMEYVSA
jgi:hypothetical protein